VFVPPLRVLPGDNHSAVRPSRYARTGGDLARELGWSSAPGAYRAAPGSSCRALVSPAPQALRAQCDTGRPVGAWPAGLDHGEADRTGRAEDRHANSPPPPRRGARDSLQAAIEPGSPADGAGEEEEEHRQRHQIVRTRDACDTPARRASERERHRSRIPRSHTCPPRLLRSDGSMEVSPPPQHDSPEDAQQMVPPFLGISVRVSAASKEESMPRHKSLLTVIRDLVQQEVRSAIRSLLGSVSTAPRAKNGRRRRRRRRGPGRPRGSENKAA
jgi:hypothetical protein